jgi:hypothetical protein
MLTTSSRRRIDGLKAPLRANCLVWGLVRLWTHGGYLAMRKSFFSPAVAHVMWSRDMITWWGYSALSGAPKGWWFMAVWFRGHVVMGDGDAVAEHARVLRARAVFVVAAAAAAAAVTATASAAAAAAADAAVAAATAAAAAATAAAVVVEKVVTSHSLSWRGHILLGLLAAMAFGLFVAWEVAP